jgi:hypothetical protein
MGVLSDLIQSIIDTPGEFADVAAQGPIEALLVLMGAILVLVPLGVFGLLVFGVVVEFVTPDSSAARHP